MWYVYFITNEDKTFHYIGITQNPRRRLEKHNEGATKSTRFYRPFKKIIIIERVETRIEARKMEKYYKSGIGREKLRKSFQLWN